MNQKKKYNWFSNFTQSEIILERITYPSVEHAFQAAKNESLQYKQKISGTQLSIKAKRLGREVELREDWEYICY